MSEHPDVAALVETVREALQDWDDPISRESFADPALAALTALAERIAEAQEIQREWAAEAGRLSEQFAEAKVKLAEAEAALERIAGEPPPQAWADASEIARAALRSLRGETTDA